MRICKRNTVPLVRHKVRVVLDIAVAHPFLVHGSAGVLLSAGFSEKSDSCKSEKGNNHFAGYEALEFLHHCVSGLDVCAVQ